MNPAIKVLNPDQALSENLLQNGDLNDIDGDNILMWSPYRQGYEVDVNSGINNSIAAYCENKNANDGRGISQTLYLNQTNPIPMLVRGWSKAQDVSGGRDSGYSIYVDITYQDNTTLWGQTGKFSTGTHDWEMQEFMILPSKPIKQLTIYGLFRGHKGSAWFDDFQLFEIGSKGVSMLDSIPIDSVVEISHPTKYDTIETSTKDGLKFTMESERGSVVSLKLDGKELAQQGIPSGFLVRDVAKGSDFYAFKNNKCEELDLVLNINPVEDIGNSLQFSGTITDTAGQDRAITLMFALPVNAVEWEWHNDVRNSKLIQESAEYINSVNINTGLNGMTSLYPFGCISNKDFGLAIAMDMGIAAQYRIAYNSWTKQFFIVYDFGLAKETEKFPNGAPFSFAIYRTDPKWGFRSAAKKLYDIFPDYFVCRSKDQGIWMPFTDVSTVEGWEDFGFKYHEGNNNVPFDDEANILSFRYTEPSTWWMRMDSEIERTHQNIMNMLNEYANSTDTRKKQTAETAIISGSFDEKGQYQYLVQNTPWCNGAVFSLNPNPYIPGNSEAKIKWNEEVKQRLYGSEAKGILDGEYLDSLEGYVTADENFRREHFKYVNVPLTFSIVSKKPVIHKASSVYEFSKWLADDIHSMGKLMFANSVPHRFAFLCPFFDVMGTETNWIGGDGSWRPDSDRQMSFRRVMCYQKPYLFLMNTRYEKFTPDLVEKYFQRCLFYGMFPSMFSHNASQDPYWRAPEFYNRDRHLFKRYIPMIKMIAEAGWEPVTYATTDNESVYVERFGPDHEGNVFFTIMNESSEKQDVTVSFINISEKIQAVQDLVSGQNVEVLSSNGQSKIHLELMPEQVCLISFVKKIR